MKKRHISIGPGAASLILIIVVLAMTMLGAMALLNAREDARLTPQRENGGGSLRAV